MLRWRYPSGICTQDPIFSANYLVISEKANKLKVLSQWGHLGQTKFEFFSSIFHSPPQY